MAKIVGSNEFNNEVKDGVVIVDFFADWCGPCKMLAPIFEEVGNEMEGKAKFIKVNVDEARDIADKFRISTIPTMMVLKNGEKKEVSVGFMPKEKIKEMVEKHL
ncbi:thioredoxin [Clostridium celatum]|uniref:Thioredoxin n=1 Tax=Clostridium celatum DSM 1785 TaxID=545697 RepID=L1QFC3_9CLOT|nr:thioredoxin [Clostridium celatum]EKY26360.1 thioredoxin [Clostridium celatum DSM 1785]MCE9655811.1 thioredoxin [Clostridium celatum]